MRFFLVYIIKSTLCLTLFYLFFKVLLSRETFFHFNRFVLLAGMIVCLLLPLIVLKVSKATVIQEPVTKIEGLFIVPKPSNEKIPSDNYASINSETVFPENAESADSISVPSPAAPFPTAQIVEIVYATGFFIAFISLLVSIFKTVRIIRRGNKIKRGENTIVRVSEPICPFSWGRYIVLTENDYRQNPEEILAHEEVHARKQHSLDLLFAELFILFQWFNPVAWLLKGELQDMHEYEADNGVINQGIDATKYQLMLVKKAVGARSYAIANSFNHSKIKIKNRITMMLKRKSTQWARLKLLLFVPLAVVLLQAFARPEIAGIEKTLSESKVTTILEEPKLPEEKPQVQQQKIGKDDRIVFYEITDSIKKIIVKINIFTVSRKKNLINWKKNEYHFRCNPDTLKLHLDRSNILSYNKGIIDTEKLDSIREQIVNLHEQFNPFRVQVLDSITRKDLSKGFSLNRLQLEEIRKQNKVINKQLQHEFQLKLDSAFRELYKKN
jgi:beta-lactamase regulating signal transducer with metallopeptidase domain